MGRRYQIRSSESSVWYRIAIVTIRTQYVIFDAVDLNTRSEQYRLMAEPDDGDVETASRDLARAIWQTVLLARDEHKARGLLGVATRRRLVEKILKLMRVVRRR
jgi:hypothetical protein